FRRVVPLPLLANERGAAVAGRASFLSSRSSATSIEIARELHVPLARRTRLAFHRRLTEGAEVELVEVVLLVGEVGRTDGDLPGVLRARPLDARVQQVVGLRAGLRNGGIDQGDRDIGADAGADLALTVVVDPRCDRVAAAAD